MELDQYSPLIRRSNPAANSAIYRNGVAWLNLSDVTTSKTRDDVRMGQEQDEKDQQSKNQDKPGNVAEKRPQSDHLYLLGREVSVRLRK